MLTEKQERIRQFIMARIAEGLGKPSYVEILTALGGSRRDAAAAFESLGEVRARHGPPLQEERPGAVAAAPDLHRTETTTTTSQMLLGVSTMNKVRTQTLLVHPAEAEAWLLRENFSRQRPLRRQHVEYLAQAMRGGRFREGTQINFAVRNGTRYLVNGQHTLAAMVASQCALLLDVQETLVETMEDVAVLYGRHDRGLARSLTDSYSAHGFAETYGFSREHTAIIGGAMPLVVSGFTSYGNYTGQLGKFMRDQDLRWGMMVDWVDESRLFFEDIRGTAGFLFKCLSRAAVVSVALVTYRYTGNDATEFWREVAKDNGLQSTHPAKTLIRFLLEHPAKMHAPNIYARYVATAWNAFFEERSLSLLRARDAGFPILIEGTPFDGKRALYFMQPDGTLVHDPIAFEPAA